MEHLFFFSSLRLVHVGCDGPSFPFLSSPLLARRTAIRLGPDSRVLVWPASRFGFVHKAAFGIPTLVFHEMGFRGPWGHELSGQTTVGGCLPF